MTDQPHQRTFNTAIQGQALIAATNGLDIRALQFTNVLQQLPPMTGSVDPLVSRMYASDLIQASVGHFLVYAATGPGGVPTNIYLGPDTPDQATNYHSLFNLQDLSDVRILDFVKLNEISNGGGSPVLLSNDSGISSNCVTVGNGPFDELFEVNAPLGSRRLVQVKKTSPTGVNFTIMPGCCGAEL